MRIGLAFDLVHDAVVFDWVVKTILKRGDELIFIHVHPNPDPKVIVREIEQHEHHYAPSEAHKDHRSQQRHEEEQLIARHMKKQDYDFKTYIAQSFVPRLASLRVEHCEVVLWGDAEIVLEKAVIELELETLVLGKRGLSKAKRLFLGSVSSHCLHHCACNVAIVPTRDLTNSKEQVGHALAAPSLDAQEC